MTAAAGCLEIIGQDPAEHHHRVSFSMHVAASAACAVGALAHAVAWLRRVDGIFQTPFLQLFSLLRRPFPGCGPTACQLP